MKILTLLGFLLLLTTSPMTNCIPGQFNAAPVLTPLYLPKPVGGSNFGLLGCSSGYTLHSTECGLFCYRFESQNCKSWADARAACKAEGAKLLEPEACSYQSFQRLALQKAARCTDFWIGGYRTLPSVNYVTVGGAPLPADFKYWAQGQPDRTGSLGGVQACVQMADELKYLMNDDGCKELAGYICQKVA